MQRASGIPCSLDCLGDTGFLHGSGAIRVAGMRNRILPSYVDGPYWQALFDVLNDLVCFGHMSGLLVRGL